MATTIGILAGIAGGSALGDATLPIEGLRPLGDPHPRCLSPWLRARSLEPGRPLPGAVLADAALAGRAVEMGVAAAIAHPEPTVALARMIDHFHPFEALAGVHPAAVVDATAIIHPTAWIGPGAVIEARVTVGEGAWVGPNAVICAGSDIGRYSRIGPCAVIGHEGFGFTSSAAGLVKIRQIGGVRIGDFAEIGAAACVDRATLGTTVVGDGSKIDNLVQVGHNAVVGEGVIIAAQTGLAGSTRIGDGAMIGGQVGVADHRRVGEGARVSGQSGVTRDVERGAVVSGTPAMPRQRWLRGLARLFREGRHDDEA